MAMEEQAVLEIQTEFQSIDLWIIEQLKGFEPEAYPIDPLLVERNISRGLLITERVFVRRNEIGELYVQKFLREVGSENPGSSLSLSH